MSQQAFHSTAKEETFEWRVILPLCLLAFVGFVHGIAILPLAVRMADSIGVSVPAIGQIQTIGLATMALAGLIAGPLADHYGHRRTILAGLTTLAASALVMAIASNFIVLLVSGLLSWLGSSMTFGVCFAVAASRYRGDAQRLSFSRLQAFQSTGTVLSAPIVTAIAVCSVWRVPYIAFILLFGVAVFMVLRTLPRDDAHGPDTVSQSKIVGAYRPFLRRRGMIHLYLASVLRAFAWIGPLLYLGALLADRYDLALTQVGLVYVVTSGCLVLGNLAAGGWIGRFNLRIVFGLMTGFLGFGWLFVYASSLPLGVSISFVGLTCFAAGVIWIALTTSLAAETPAGKGTTMVLNFSIFGVGSSLSVGIGGVLIGISGYQAMGIDVPLFVVLAGVLPILPMLGARRNEALAAEEPAT